MQSHSIWLAAVSEELRSQNLEPAINIEIIIEYDNMNNNDSYDNHHHQNNNINNNNNINDNNNNNKYIDNVNNINDKLGIFTPKENASFVP